MRGNWICNSIAVITVALTVSMVYVALGRRSQPAHADEFVRYFPLPPVTSPAVMNSLYHDLNTTDSHTQVTEEEQEEQPALQTPDVPPHRHVAVTGIGTACTTTEGRFWFSSQFGSHMVLQRGTTTYVSGWTTTAGLELVMSLSTHNRTVYSAACTLDAWSDPERPFRWLCRLPPQRLRDPVTITVAMSARPRQNQCTAIRLERVVFGDVFYCGGQSNMWFPITFHVSNKLLYPNPLIRVLLVTEIGAPDEVSEPPLTTSGVDDHIAPAGWTVADNMKKFSQFSTVCYLFAQHLFAKLPIADQWPIGLISAAARDKAIFNFLPKNLPSLGADCIFQLPPRASHYWNTFMAPFRNHSVRGVLWYQGESDTRQPQRYHCRLQALILALRSHFLSYHGRLPFLVFNLHAYHARRPLGNAIIREHQMKVAAAIPNVTVVAGFDSWGAVMSHPPDKDILAQRAAAIALTHWYDVPGLVHSGPTVEGMVLHTAPSAENALTLELRFASSTLGPSYYAFARHKNCSAPAFEVSFHPASNDMDMLTWTPVPRTTIHTGQGGYGGTIELHLGSLPTPNWLRYSFANLPMCAVYNNAGWPMLPFRTALKDFL